jgi:hypothetical protein
MSLSSVSVVGKCTSAAGSVMNGFACHGGGTAVRTVPASAPWNRSAVTGRKPRHTFRTKPRTGGRALRIRFEGSVHFAHRTNPGGVRSCGQFNGEERRAISNRSQGHVPKVMHGNSRCRCEISDRPRRNNCPGDANAAMRAAMFTVEPKMSVPCVTRGRDLGRSLLAESAVPTDTPAIDARAHAERWLGREIQTSLRRRST